MAVEGEEFYGSLLGILGYGKEELQLAWHKLCAWASALFLHNLCRHSGDSVA